MTTTTAITYRNEMITSGCEVIGSWPVGADSITIYRLTDELLGTAKASPVTHFVYAPAAEVEGWASADQTAVIDGGWEYVSGLSDAYESAAEFADRLGAVEVAATIRRDAR